MLGNGSADVALSPLCPIDLVPQVCACCVLPGGVEDLGCVRVGHSRKEHVARPTDLIEEGQVDDVLEKLIEEFNQEIDFYGLMDLCGREKYVAAMRREAIELKMNSISPEQTADLWNRAGKPSVGGSRWNALAITALLR